MNQQKFAKRIGLTQTYMSMIELGKTTTSDKNIKLICAEFGINENWLRTGNGEMFGTVLPHEKELLSIFNKLPPDTQKIILDLARNILKQIRNDPENK
jgi:transcriptional regulator with XRE-family HTH domain